MHLPIFSLVTGAIGCLMRLERLTVDGLYGKVEEDVFDLPCFDVILFDLWQRLTDVSSAKGSLEIREVEDR